MLSNTNQVYTYQIPQVSTCHITKEDDEKLTDKYTLDRDVMCFICTRDEGAGYFVYVDEDNGFGMSESFHKLIKWAVTNNYDFVRVCSWGGVVECLDVNAW